MPYFRLTAERFIYADNKTDARELVEKSAREFAISAMCQELGDDLDLTLCRLSDETVQSVAHEELGRELTHEEVEFVQQKTDDYIDWYESLAQCIRDRCGDHE